MTDPTPSAQQLLDEARAGHEPSAADEARVREALHARVLANPLLLSAKGTHALASAAKLTWGKLVLTLGLGGAAMVGAVVVSQGLGSREPALSARQASTTASARASLAAKEQATPASTQAPGQAANAAAPAVNGAAPLATQTRPSAALSASAPVAAVAPASASASLSPRDMQLEIAGLSRAQQLLHSGSARQALSALDQLTAQVPRGALMEERDATRALAQCALFPQNSFAATFIAHYPKSVHAARVRSACASDE